MQQSPRLYYIHDPMCSWCYGFDATRIKLFEKLDGRVEIERYVGGLAPDSDEPMPLETRQFLQQTWHKIADKIPGVYFNHAFWEKCQPRRSTYPACRAVIAARQFGVAYDELMTAAIQRAYYQEARNPSDDSTLIELSHQIGLDAEQFAKVLSAPQTQVDLVDEIARCRSMGQDSYPSLLLQTADASRWQIALDYNNAETMYVSIVELLEKSS